MQIVNAPQGSPEWHAHRAGKFNASDAPAMLGISPYKTRSELMRELAAGVTAEIDPATQRRFDDGHRYEALARPLAEQIIGEELYPVVGYEGRLSASFDGLTLASDVVFEHKTLNDTLRGIMSQPGVTGASLPMHYRAQLEQQLMLAEAGRALFMASTWDDDGNPMEQMHVWYEVDTDMRQLLLQGWAQFAIDLEAYQPGNEQPALVLEPARTPETLPALLIEASGSVTRSNLEPFKLHALEVIGGIKTDLQNDQDFADAEATVKWLKADVADQLKAAKAHAQAQMTDVDTLFRAIDDIVAAADSKRLQLEKLVKTRKDEIRTSIISAAQLALDAHVAELNNRMPQPWLNRIMGAFVDVIRGKRSLTSMQDAIDGELARCKIEANELAGRLQDNAAALRDDEGRDWMFLFADFKVAGLKPTEDFHAIAAQRIQQHQQAEELRKQQEADAAAKAADVMQRASVPVSAPVVAAPAPAARQSEDAPMLRLGQINALLAPIKLDADGLATLGFQPAAKDKAARLYLASDLPAICDAIASHVRWVCPKEAV